MTENIKLESDGLKLESDGLEPGAFDSSDGLEPGAFDLGDCGESVVTSPDQVATVFPYPRDEGT